MLKIITFAFLIGGGICSANSQVPTQWQCQQADAQLNQVYQQLRGTLNDAQKQQLKLEQRAWIKERDNHIRNNPNDAEGAFHYATEKRINYLKNKIEGIQGDRAESANDLKVSVVPQNFPTDQGCVSENEDLLIVGCDTQNWTSYALIFDKKSNLLLKKAQLGQFELRELYLPNNAKWFVCRTWDKNDGDAIRIFSIRSTKVVDSQNDDIGDIYNQKLDSENSGHIYISDSGDLITYGKYAGIGQKSPLWYSRTIGADGQIGAEEPLNLRYKPTTKPLFSELFQRQDIRELLQQKLQYSEESTDKLNQLKMEDNSVINISTNGVCNKLDLISAKITCSKKTANDHLTWIYDNDTMQISSNIRADSGVVKYTAKRGGIVMQEVSIDEDYIVKDININQLNLKGIKINNDSNQQTNKCFGEYESVLCISNTQSGVVFPISCIRDSYSKWSDLKYYPDKGLVSTCCHTIRYNCASDVIPSLQLRKVKDGSLVFKTDDWDSICFSGDKMYCSWGDRFGQRSGLSIFNTTSYKSEKFFPDVIGMDPIVSDGNRIAGIWKEEPTVIRLYDLKSGNPLCSVTPVSKTALLVYTPDNYYMSGFGKSGTVAFRFKNRAYPFEQFDLRLNRPDIVLERLGAPKEAIETAKSLREKRLKRMGVTEEMLKPDFHLPELQIVGEVPATTPKDQLDLQIKASDDKYPLDRLRVYVNNVPVNGRDGELLRDQKTQSLEKPIPIKLAAGRNKIQVSVLNSAGAESLYANAEVNCTVERPKPKLYAVALGVSQYARPEWCLKYAAKDATDLIGKLKAKSGSSYSEVKPLLLTDKEVTKESAAKIKEFLSGATIDDTVLIFMAGHGLLDDKYDYYFGTSDIDPAKPSERGMPYEAIDNILAEVPSLKKALLMDTCHAGELDDDEKKELAATDGSAIPSTSPDTSTNSSPNPSPLAGKVAMRAIGTRGMSVKAIEGAKGKSDWYEKLQDMFVDLRRGSGATVISSSQGAEYAFESSEQSNGLFTYSLMEALDGKATPNKEHQITISSVGDYVKKRVQDLTKGKQNPNLRGVNLEEDFTLSAAK